MAIQMGRRGFLAGLAALAVAPSLLKVAPAYHRVDVADPFWAGDGPVEELMVSVLVGKGWDSEDVLASCHARVREVRHASGVEYVGPTGLLLTVQGREAFRVSRVTCSVPKNLHWVKRQPFELPCPDLPIKVFPGDTLTVLLGDRILTVS